MDWSTIMWWVMAAVTVIPALMIVLSKDIVRLAFWLLASLTGVAGLYILLGADFLGFTQVLVYIGGIMVLILFGIMMTNRDAVLMRRGETTGGAMVTGLVIAAATALALLKVVKDTKWKEAAPVEMPVTTARVGEALLTDYVLPFELVSVLLLIVLCGAAYIARRRPEET